MIDLRKDIADLARSLERIPAENGGRQIMVMAVEPRGGASSVAGSLALLLSGRSSRATWLVDLDLLGNTQYEAFRKGEYGRKLVSGKLYDASFNVQPFFRTLPQLRTRKNEENRPPKLLVAHSVSATRLFVTRFRVESLNASHRVQLDSSPHFWKALRKASDWCVVDAPSLEDSSAALAVVRNLDGVVLVVSADRTSVDQINAMRDEIEAHGGHCLGIVVNGVRPDAQFVDRFTL